MENGERELRVIDALERIATAQEALLTEARATTNILQRIGDYVEAINTTIWKANR